DGRRGRSEVVALLALGADEFAGLGIRGRDQLVVVAGPLDNSGRLAGLGLQRNLDVVAFLLVVRGREEGGGALVEADEGETRAEDAEGDLVEAQCIAAHG